MPISCHPLALNFTPSLRMHNSILLRVSGYIIHNALVFCLAPGLKQVHKRSKDQREQDAGVINQDGVYSGTVYIEAMLTADKTTCDYYGNGTLDYLLSAANLVRLAC